MVCATPACMALSRWSGNELRIIFISIFPRSDSAGMDPLMQAGLLGAKHEYSYDKPFTAL